MTPPKVEATEVEEALKWLEAVAAATGPELLPDNKTLAARRAKWATQLLARLRAQQAAPSAGVSELERRLRECEGTWHGAVTWTLARDAIALLRSREQDKTATSAR